MRCTEDSRDSLLSAHGGAGALAAAVGSGRATQAAQRLRVPCARGRGLSAARVRSVIQRLIDARSLSSVFVAERFVHCHFTVSVPRRLEVARGSFKSV